MLPSFQSTRTWCDQVMTNQVVDQMSGAWCDNKRKFSFRGPKQRTTSSLKCYMIWRKCLLDGANKMKANDQDNICRNNIEIKYLYVIFWIFGSILIVADLVSVVVVVLVVCRGEKRDWRKWSRLFEHLPYALQIAINRIYVLLIW